MFCEYCGKPIEATAKFCEHCGAKVEAAAPVYPPEPASEPVSAAPETPYSQPETPYSQPGASYSRPGSSYSRPGSSYNSYGAQTPGSGGVSVTAKPEARILGIPVRGPALWIVLGVIAVILVAVILIVKLGGDKNEPSGDEPRSFDMAEVTPEPAPEPTPKPKAEPAADAGMAEISGFYKLTQMSSADGSDLGTELELMEAIGLSITMQLERDGTGVMSLYGEDAGAITWDENGITVEGDTAPYVYADDTITVEADGDTMVFGRITYAEYRSLTESVDIEGVFGSLTDDYDLDDDAVAGVYYATSCTRDGEDEGVDDEMLYLDEDGTGCFLLFGTVYEIEWALDGEDFYFIDDTDDEFYGTLRNGVIEGEYYNGYCYVLDRHAAPVRTAYYDADDYSGYGDPTVRDFDWLTYEIAYGIRPSGAEALTDFDEVCGGWMCYILDDLTGDYGSNMERLLNVTIDGTEEDTDVTFDWLYAYDGDADEGYDEDGSTVFSGNWRGGVITAEGPGLVWLTGFWYLDGHEYGIGTFMWPDGMPALVALVRP